jgi:Helix-turn-helix domain of resolvase
VSARKPSVDRQAVRQLKAQGLSADDIAEKLNVGRASVYRLLSQYQSFISIRGCEMHSNRDFPFRLWGWTKVREANIPDNIREEFELLGEDVIAMAVAGAVTTNISLNVVYQNHDKAVAWLREQRDRHTYREDRLEAVEWAILIAVIVSVVVDIALLYRG